MGQISSALSHPMGFPFPCGPAWYKTLLVNVRHSNAIVGMPCVDVCVYLNINYIT